MPAEAAMPIHDWTRVDAGIFHHLHASWIAEIARTLNRMLPPDVYALAEQIAGRLGPDVLALQVPVGQDWEAGGADDCRGGMALATAPPRVRFRQAAERDPYAAKANVVKLRHRSNHRVVAVIEIVPPGNKSTQHALKAFVSKAREFVDAGVHLLIVDLFPPGPRDPQGLHQLLWDYFGDGDFAAPANEPLTLVSYRAGSGTEAFVETAAVGAELPEMPVFLTPETYISLPLESTYLSAWEAVPAYWRNVVSAGAGS
jgi:hypothetical protein